MWLRSLCSDNNSCAILGGLQRDGLADAATGAGDQDGLSREFTAKTEKITSPFGSILTKKQMLTNTVWSTGILNDENPSK